MAVSTDDLAIFPPEGALPATTASTRRSPSRVIGGLSWLVGILGTVALGLILPHVNTADQARAIVDGLPVWRMVFRRR